MKNAKLMLSGGMDSATTLFDLVGKYNLSAIFFDYGQRTMDYELTCARFLCRSVDVSLEVIDLSGVKKTFLGLSEKPIISLGFYGGSRANCPHGLFGLAASLCVNSGAELLITGMVQEDTVGLGDVGVYLKKWSSALRDLQNVEFEFDFPYLNKSKSEVVKIGEKLSVPFNMTRSCYEDNQYHCGRCAACLERKKSFADSMINDPTVYLF